MDLATLKATQTPIKEQYKVDARSALVMLRSNGVVVPNEQQCLVTSFAGDVRAGLHPAAGGSDRDACSAEMLLESLVACAGVTLGAVATNMSIEIRRCEIEAIGSMDFRGTLGVDRTAPVGLTNIQLQFVIDSNATEELLAKLISLTERYCVIYQTLKAGVPVETTLKHHS
jgi:uncharacterized OsmC-like protein